MINRMPIQGNRKGMDCSFQTGDMGIGFSKDFEYKYSLEGKSYPPILNQNHKWMRGNHDDPEMSRNHPNNIGDYGYDEHTGIFYVSGGFSIDHQYRKDYYERKGIVTWWEDEELSLEEFEKVLELYKKSKPSIVVTHECPTIIKRDVITNGDKLFKMSRTENFLQNMFEIYKPNYWIFGHHHKRVEKKIKNTQFVGLNEVMFGPIKECYYEIPNLKWKEEE